MPKTLRESVPSSAVARFLDKSAAARALEPARPASAPSQELLTSARDDAERALASPRLIKREFILSAETDEAFSELLETFRRATQTRLTASHLLRAMCRAAGHAAAVLEREAKRLGPLRLPPNARGCDVERETFEGLLTSAIVAGMRAAGAYEASADEAARSRDRTGR